MSLSHTAIAQSCTAAVVEQYIAAFKDPWKRDTEVSQLVTVCGQTAISDLTRALKTGPGTGVREAAAMAVGYIGGASATKELIFVLKTDSAPTVRKTAADALGYIRATTAINSLMITLENRKESTDVRQAAAEALGQIGGTMAINRLISILKNIREPIDLRQAAAKALQQLGEQSTEALVVTMQDSDLRTRYWAVAALSAIESPRSIKALEANKVKVTQILEAAYKADIVEFDRAPVGSTSRASGSELARKPLVCKIKWITQYWARCG